MEASETIYFLPRVDTKIHIISQVDNQEAQIFIKNEKQRFGTRYIRKLTDKEKSMDQQNLADELVEETLSAFQDIGKSFSKLMDDKFKKLDFKKY